MGPGFEPLRAYKAISSGIAFLLFLFFLSHPFSFFSPSFSFLFHPFSFFSLSLSFFSPSLFLPFPIPFLSFLFSFLFYYSILSSADFLVDEGVFFCYYSVLPPLAKLSFVLRMRLRYKDSRSAEHVDSEGKTSAAICYGGLFGSEKSLHPIYIVSRCGQHSAVCAEASFCFVVITISLKLGQCFDRACS